VSQLGGTSLPVRLRRGDERMTARISRWPGSSSAPRTSLRVRSRRRGSGRTRSTPGPRAKRCRGSSKNSRTVASSRDVPQVRTHTLPPRFSRRVLPATDEWTFLQDTGTIETFSVSYSTRMRSELWEPILVGVVSLDGASPKRDDALLRRDDEGGDSDRMRVKAE